ISKPEQAAKMAAISDGAIVGSAIIKLINEDKETAPERVGEYVKQMKSAVAG
nr:tryptophan synthase subunit alpha [Lachnospiraceae bacterium]